MVSVWTTPVALDFTVDSEGLGAPTSRRSLSQPLWNGFLSSADRSLGLGGPEWAQEQPLAIWGGGRNGPGQPGA